MFQALTSRLKSTRQSERGLSVIEITVVLLIIAIIAAFLVPQAINYMRKYRLGMAAQNVATALQRARYLATSNNTRAGILVSSFQQLDIRQFDPLGNGEPQSKGIINLPEGVTISDDAPKEIAFDGRGLVTPLPNASHTIRINGPSGYYMIVTVSPTGQVTMGDALRDEGI
jgi:type II secretory pathway pseudopilin PulG